MLRGLSEETKFDIILMDIQLGDSESGIAVATAIKRLYPDTLIIYGSAYESYYRDLANAEPFLFLPKPVTEHDIHNALERAVKRIESTIRKYYHFTSNGEQHKVDLNKVLYIESAYKKIVIKTLHGEYEFWGQLSQVYEEIEKTYPFFIQISRSIIVNYINAECFKKTEVIVNGEPLAIGRTFEEECAKKQLQFFRQSCQ